MAGPEIYSTTIVYLTELTTAQSNSSAEGGIQAITIDRKFIWLLCSLVSVIAWVVYIAYYNSRVIGYVITRLLNKFVIRDGYVKVGKQRGSYHIEEKPIQSLNISGSFTLCALSGKIMFRDVVYVTTDYSVRIQDGWLIFRWWRSYVPKDVSEGDYFSL